MKGLLGFVLLLVGGALLVAVPSAPPILVAVFSYRKRAGQPYLLRSLGFSLLSAALTGVVMAVAGFVFGAGIGDENAGEAAAFLFGLGLVFGGVSGLLFSFLVIACACWQIASRAGPAVAEVPHEEDGCG